jgi:hypothetical protein
MNLKSSLTAVIAAAMSIITVLTIAINIAPQPAEATDKYCILGYPTTPDDSQSITFAQCFKTEEQCEEGRQIDQQNHPDFVFTDCHKDKGLGKLLK